MVGTSMPGGVGGGSREAPPYPDFLRGCHDLVNIIADRAIRPLWPTEERPERSAPCHPEP